LWRSELRLRCGINRRRIWKRNVFLYQTIISLYFQAEIVKISLEKVPLAFYISSVISISSFKIIKKKYQIRMHRGEKEANLQSLLRCEQQRQIQFWRGESRKKSQMQTRGDQKKSFHFAMLTFIQIKNLSFSLYTAHYREAACIVDTVSS